MRHGQFGNQLGRSTNQVKALYRGLIIEVLKRGKIQTTKAKARAILGEIDRVVNLAKRNTLFSRREVAKILGGSYFEVNFFSEIGKKFSDRTSGYTRMISLGKRFSDDSKMVVLELIGAKDGQTEKEVVVVEGEKPKKKGKKYESNKVS